jgi:hypothetical protein
MPKLLQSIGVDVKAANKARGGLMSWFNPSFPALPEHSSDGGKGIDHGSIDITPGDGLGK